MTSGRLPLLASCLLFPVLAKCQDKAPTLVVPVTAAQHDGKSFYKPIQLRTLQLSLKDGNGFFSLESSLLSFISNTRPYQQPETLLTLRQAPGPRPGIVSQAPEQPVPLWSNYSDIDGDTIFDTMSQVFPKGDIKSFILFQNAWTPVTSKKAPRRWVVVFCESGKYVFRGRLWEKLVSESPTSPATSERHTHIYSRRRKAAKPAILYIINNGNQLMQIPRY